MTVIPSMVTFGAARGIVGAFESSKAVINCAKGPSQDNGLNIVRGDIPIGVWLHALIYVAKICKACRVDVIGVKYWRIFGHDGINVASINAAGRGKRDTAASSVHFGWRGRCRSEHEQATRTLKFGHRV